MKKISIIAPTLNEEENISTFIRKIKKLKLKNYEIIVVDDSTDKTPQIAKFMMRKLKIDGKIIKRYGKKGKGSAIRDGLKICKGDYIVLIDADLQYPVEKIPIMLKKLEKYDIVLTRKLRKDSFYRKILGTIFRILVFLLFGIKEETQSTMKAFRKIVKEKVNFNSNGWAWDVEFIYKAKKLGFKFTNIPVIYSERKGGKSKINFLTPIKMFLEILKIRLREN